MTTGSVTRTLAFNGYRVGSGSAWLESVSVDFDAVRLDALLEGLVETLGAVVIERSATNYEPIGASAGMLIGQPASAFAHLTESHAAIHTYPDTHPSLDLATFRVECELSSCGPTSPIECLPLLLRTFGPDLLTLDLRDRGVLVSADGLVPAAAAPAPTAVAGFSCCKAQGGFGLYVREDLSGHETLVDGLAERLAAQA